MGISANYLYENGYIENVLISQFEDGESFAILEDWDDVYEINYAVVKILIPEALPLYSSKGMIKERKWGGGASVIEDLRIDGVIPTVVSDVLAKNNLHDRDIVEAVLGCSWGFADEYTLCDDCGNVIRTEPTSYHWQPDYYLGDGFILCNGCFKENGECQSEYIESHINNYKSAVNGLMSEEDIEGLGFEKVDGLFQGGWYDRNDDPKEIYNRLSERFYEVLFFIDNVGQFHTDFVVFVRGEIEED